MFYSNIQTESFLVPSECENYYTFGEADRNGESEESGFFCDSSDIFTSQDWQGEGWYRFTGKAGESFHLF